MIYKTRAAGCETRKHLQQPSPATGLPSTLHSRDGLDHGQAHHDGAGSVVLSVVRQPADAVVAVTQDLDPQLVVFLNVLEKNKEQLYQLRWYMAVVIS